MEICPKCGLPKEACVCDQIAKGSQRIRISTDKKRYGKVVTLVTGFGSGIDVKEIAKSLKNSLACGGTSKDNIVELQGDHKKKIKEILTKLGFDSELIED
jgi:translation initiation factor 1